jgi:UPF0716 family protein affecting phage T7 exclusion
MGQRWWSLGAVFAERMAIGVAWAAALAIVSFAAGAALIHGLATNALADAARVRTRPPSDSDPFMTAFLAGVTSQFG